MNPVPIKNLHRKDIEALRAIAVLAVVFYHAGVNGFHGGYVGVDIFFVISGYLITNILVTSVQRDDGNIYKNFYIKRARRIFPALFFTLLLTTIGAILLFPSSLLSFYGASLISSVFSISNIYFYTQSGYFDSSANLKPLLHTWSLGVEEQFYLFWPVFIAFVYSPRIYRAKLFPILIFSIGFLSLIAAQYILLWDAAASFFLTPFRIFEFALGAILCWIKPTNSNDRYLTLVYILSILLLGLGIFFFNERTTFPGINALVPCLGAALFIYANYHGKVIEVYKYFGLLYIGRLSYSIYLVHWPVVVFWSYSFDVNRLDAVDSICIIFISFILAVISFYFVENPCRNPKSKNLKFIFIAGVLSLTLVCIGVSQIINHGWPWRPWRSLEFINSKTLEKEKELRFLTRQKICNKKGWETCDAIIPDKTNVLVIGDSHAVDALNALEAQFPDFNYALSTLGGCPPYKDISSIAPNGLPDLERCKRLNQDRHDVPYLKKFDLLVINNFMGWYTPKNLLSYLQFLHNNGLKKVIVFDNYISLKKEMPSLLNVYGYNEKEIRQWISRDYVSEPELGARASEFGYLYIDKRSIFCKKENCMLFDIEGNPFTYDSNHLSYKFSRKMLEAYKEKILNYMLSN